MSSLFVEDRKRGLSDTSAGFQLLLSMPVDRLHNVTGFQELLSKKEMQALKSIYANAEAGQQVIFFQDGGWYTEY